MTNKRNRASFYVFSVGLFLIGVMFVALGTRPTLYGSSESRPSLIPPRDIKSFTLGYDELVADSLWLRTIQDFDFCENRKSQQQSPADFKCERGWVFHMIDATTELAPKFRQPYLTGALMLTVIVNDIAGASAIFDKAVARFPTDGTLLYNAAYQALIEEKNEPKASELLIRAGKNGAPNWVFSLAARLQQKSGQLLLARSILLESLEENKDRAGSERIRERLAEVEAELAKQPKEK